MSSGQADNGRERDSSARHSSITDLELAFAQNPESTAYVDLCLAYVEQGRFMEAMVVCKKGIKAHPDSIDARVLLAQVYGAQKKFKKALQELDEVASAFPGSGAALLARAKMRISAGEDAGVVDDLKKAIDLDASLGEATKLLADRGIEYPEKPKAPEPPPPPPPTGYAIAGTPYGMQLVQFGGGTPAGFSGALPPMPPFVIPIPPGGQITGDLSPLPRASSELRPAGDGSGGSAPADGPQPLPRGISVVPGMPIYPAQIAFPQGFAPVQPRLEGEEELEELAKKVANEKPDQGRPKTSLYLAIGLFVAGASVVGYRFSEKRRIEAIDNLTTSGSAAFNQDTYGSYKSAAGYFEQILNRHDSRHALTLGRLAHVYAILVGEHGEIELQDELAAVLARAEKDAPEVSHTVAARGLAILSDGKDRQANAAKARATLAPIVQKVKELEGAPSYADLTLAIADLELGDYDNATQALGNVKQVLPGSVRAKVWHARAAFRANRLGTAEAAFLEALRAQPGHPGARAGLALVKMVRGDLNGAAEAIIKFDELPGKEISERDRALAEFARSQVLRAAGEESKAVGAYELAVRLDPGNADFPYGFGKWLVENGREKEALPYLRKAVDMEKTRVLFLIALAEAEMNPDAPDYDSASKHIEEAIRRAPGLLEGGLAKARLLRRTKSPETEAHLAKVQEQWPTAEAEVNLELGRYLRATGKLDEAKAALERAIEKMGGHAPARQGDIVLSYGKLMEDRGEQEIALKSYKQAGDLGSIEAWFRVASLLARSPDKEGRSEAKRACDRYLAAGVSLRYSNDARELCATIR